MERLTYYKCELIALHPFHELNGRVTRLFIDLICIRKGYGIINYSLTTAEEYIQASIATVRYADNSPMRDIIIKGMK